MVHSDQVSQRTGRQDSGGAADITRHGENQQECRQGKIASDVRPHLLLFLKMVDVLLIFSRVGLEGANYSAGAESFLFQSCEGLFL